MKKLMASVTHDLRAPLIGMDHMNEEI